MTYQIQMEFLPGVSQIWVRQLTPDSPIYEYDNEEEAINKANELQSLDNTGRQYRVHEF
jgi:hypothetical protein